MAINLQKGQRVDLSKEAPNVSAFTIGLGWDARATDGKEFDLDASLLLVDAEGKCKGIEDLCYYNNKVLHGGAVDHQGDNTTGQGDGDDEQIKIDLSRVPDYVKKIVVTVTIHEADQRGQNFGQVSNAYVRLLESANNTEKLKYDLTEDASIETAMIFCELNRKDTGWSFAAVGQGKAAGLAGVLNIYGLDA
jgi:tellurium resistance protein TerD